MQLNFVFHEIVLRARQVDHVPGYVRFVIRNAVLESSTTCPGQEIMDCDVANLVGKKCTVEWDDSCSAVPDATEVYECGGWQEIYRKIVVNPQMDVVAGFPL